MKKEKKTVRPILRICGSSNRKFVFNFFPYIWRVTYTFPTKKKKNENRFFYMKDPRPYFQLGITSIFFNVYLFDLVS